MAEPQTLTRNGSVDKDDVDHKELASPALHGHGYVMTPAERQEALDAATRIDPGPAHFSLAALQVRRVLPLNPMLV